MSEQKPKLKIGFDWPLVKKTDRFTGIDTIWARDQHGNLHRVTERMVQDESIEFIKKFGPHS